MADGGRQAAFAEEAVEGGNGRLFANRLKSFAKKKARGMSRDSEWGAVLAVAEPELAL
jgi:hypothetical protein